MTTTASHLPPLIPWIPVLNSSTNFDFHGYEKTTTCSCLSNDHPCRPLESSNCSLSYIIDHSDHPSTVMIARTRQFSVLRKQWQRKGCVDGRCESLLDGVIQDMIRGVFPVPSKYLDRFEMFDSTLIGSGSNGRIYISRQKTDGTKVAVKIVLYMKSGVRKEIDMLRKCQSNDYIVPFLGAYSENPIVAFIVTKLQGHPWLNQSLKDSIRVNLFDLSAFINSQTPSQDQLCIIIPQLFNIVHFLHYQKFVTHGDIKPSNFVIDKDLKVKLLDMSSCQDIRKSYILTTFKGTAFYAWPEALEKKPYDGRLNDLWGLGMTIHALCYGWKSIPNFDNPTKLTKLKANCKKEFEEDLQLIFNVLFQRVKNPLIEFTNLLHLWKDQDDRHKRDLKILSAQKSIKRWFNKLFSG